MSLSCLRSIKSAAHSLVICNVDMSKSETVLSSASVVVTWEMLQPFVEFDSQELLSQCQCTVNLRTAVTR